MSGGVRNFALIAATCLSAGLSTGALAQNSVSMSASASSSVGYSRNPYFFGGPDTDSAYAEINVQPQIVVRREHDAFTLAGDLNYSQYFRRYADSASGRVSVDYSGTPSPRVGTHLNLGFDSSIVGSNYGIGGIVDPTLPIPPANSGVDISLFGARERRSSFNANGGLTLSPAAHDKIDLSAFFTSSNYGGTSSARNYNGYGGGAGYSRQMSETIWFGARASYSRSNDKGLLGNSDIYTGQATLSGKLAGRWTLNGAIGITVTDRQNSGSDKSLSGSFGLCRSDVRDALCFNVRRAVLPTGTEGTQNTTSISATYSYKVTQHGTLAFSANYDRNDGIGLALTGRDDSIGTTVGFEQQMYKNVHLSTSGRYRKIHSGLVPRSADIGGQVGVSVQFGGGR